MENENRSRGASIETARSNVFGDEHAVDPSDASSGSSSPTESIDSQPEELSPDHDHGNAQTPREYTPPGLPGNTTGLARLSSSHRSLAADSSADPQRAASTSQSMADNRRTLSTSSRFSIPRAQSPYQGPTAPSQPYGLYPQITRASSIASESTIRPSEHPFIAQGGPEHPYSMYPQNTVPEEDDSSGAHIPLGFPGMGQNFSPESSSSGNEVGDIVGSDGHVEQLPPYSRYADNVIAKGDMARIDPQTSSASEETNSASTLPPAATSDSDVELTAVREGPSVEEVARKEGFKEKMRRRKCCGLPIWTVAVLITVIVLAAVLGGVIGGIVGNKKGTDRALASGATTTVWLDADPAQTGPTTPSCPTGHYTVPLNQTQEIYSCVVDGQYTQTWECLDTARLGINIFESAGGGPPLSVVFDDYSVRPQLFRYGPQPPDFNGTAFVMQPYKDKEDDELGIALFFSVLFDKLIIIPDGKISPPSDKKRSVSAPFLAERGYGNSYSDDDYLNVGDKPWYCFWNSTISEFWVFLDQDMDDASNPTQSGSSTITSASSMPTAVYDPSNMSGPLYGGSLPTSMNPAATTPYPVQPTNEALWTGKKHRRGDAAPSIGSGNFPKLAKMVEKRKPDNNVQPYCQQMQVLNNWQIVAIPDIPTIEIAESEFGPAATGGGNRRAVRKRSPDTIQQLGSNCICEWFSV